MSLNSVNNEEKIWNYFKSKDIGDYGCAGLLGNLLCESGLKPNNMQDTYQKKLGYNDETYTEAVDNETYTNFINDKVGYGLAQWTYWSRKKALYEYAKSKNKSIGDLDMQLDFIYKELTELFKDVMRDLKSATSILEASNSVLIKYEAPASQSASAPADQKAAVQAKRAEYSQMFYDKYHKESDDNMSKFTNSSLVSYTKISPNKTSPRTHDIDTITIHCVVGQCSVESLGNIFAKDSKDASCNYGIGYDGKIGMYVEEKDRSWCSSNSANDNRAITIEVASDTTHPYAVNDKAYEALIELVADICKRNNIKELKWKADKSLIGQVDKQNMTVHRWFANKACPGDYLYSRHGEIADRVNKILGLTTHYSKPVEPRFKLGDKVKLVSGATYTSGKSIPAWVFKMSLYVRDIDGDTITISTLKTGAITGKVNQKYLVTLDEELVAVPEIKEEVASPSKFKVGDEVKLIAGAKYTSGKNIASFVFNRKLYVRAVKGDEITVSTLKIGAITGKVNEKYLTHYNANGDTKPVPKEESSSTNVAFKIGDSVRLTTGAKYVSGRSIPSWVAKKTLYVRKINGNDITISIYKIGAITGTVNAKYLIKE